VLVKSKLLNILLLLQGVIFHENSRKIHVKFAVFRENVYGKQWKFL